MSKMRRLFVIIFAFYGSPIRSSQHGPSWVQIFYSFAFISLCSAPYAWSRFLSKLFIPSTGKVVPIDSLPLVSSISGCEMVAVFFANYYHTFVLIKKHKIFRRLFIGGRVMEIFGFSDLLLVSFCLIVFLVNFITQNTIYSQLRFITYCFCCSINHLIAFQFCAVLKYHTAEITSLIILLRSHNAHGQSTRMLLSCIIKYWEILRTIQESSDEFSYQILVVFAGLVVDMIYLISYILILLRGNLVHGLQLAYFIHVVIIRVVMILYFCGHCQNVIRVGEDFNSALFGLIRDNSSYYNNNSKAISYLRMKQVPRLTAFGFYDYGCPIVITASSAVATYLVVLLQLSGTN